MSHYAIGDIQGCLKPLECLLEKIQFDPQKDRLWIAGDLINRGPDSLAVLRLLYKLRDSVTAVLGNHDLHFLAVARGLRKQGKNDTLAELLHADDLQELTEWLRHCKLLHHDAPLGFTMVHAGIPPQWNLAQAQHYAREVEKVLHSAAIDEYLSAMYGNEPNRWSNELTGQDRLRLITNYFTRMRFVTADGELELKTKDNATAAPVGFSPWFTLPHRQTINDKIIFGHWATLNGQANTAGIFALDTGCVWGGALTALRLEDEKLFSCACS